LLPEKKSFCPSHRFSRSDITNSFPCSHACKRRGNVLSLHPACPQASQGNLRNSRPCRIAVSPCMEALAGPRFPNGHEHASRSNKEKRPTETQCARPKYPYVNFDAKTDQRRMKKRWTGDDGLFISIAAAAGFRRNQHKRSERRVWRAREDSARRPYGRSHHRRNHASPGQVISASARSFPRGSAFRS